MSSYTTNSWKPIKHRIIKDDQLKEIIHTKGFSISPFLPEESINRLEQIYSTLHQLKADKGGMFYSIYSQDITYRKRVFESVNEVIAPYFDSLFKGYKVVLYSFVVKLPGEESEFYIHQDTTGMDEWKDSPLSLWIPLQDVDERNGCLGIIPHSHWFFSPYRSISFPAPFDEIQPTVKRFLQPVQMKRGEALIFDNRAVHHSYANSSDTSRIALICGLFPKDTPIITCHKPTYTLGGKMELIEHEDDFLLTGKNFLVDCQKRPENGKSLGWIADPYVAINSDEFEQLCHSHGVSPKADFGITSEPISCNMIGEPIVQPPLPREKPSFLKRFIPSFFKHQ